LISVNFSYDAEAIGSEPKEFCLALGEGVQSANPFIGIYDSDHILYSIIYDSLTAFDKDGNVVPNLAKSWWYMDGGYAAATGSSTSDLLGRQASEWPLGSIWEYNLTEGVNWSDGEPFDADDVVFTFDLQTGDNYATFWAYQPYTKWIDHAQKVNQYKVRLFFTDRKDSGNPPIPAAWGDSILMPILPKHFLQEKSPVEIAQNWTGVPAIGTGPFKGTDDPAAGTGPFATADLEHEIISKEKITLVRNPEWEKGLGRIYDRTCEIDKFIMKFYPEEQVLILDLKAKKVDATKLSAINYLSLKHEEDNPSELKLISKYCPTEPILMSYFSESAMQVRGGSNPSRYDPALHRACALATDKELLVAEVLKGLGIPGTGLINPVYPEWYYDAFSDAENISWFNVTSNTGAILYSYHGPVGEVNDFNITKANEILDAAGYEWSGIIGEYRTVGDVAAKRLVALGAAENISSAKTDPKTGNPRILEFEDILEQVDFMAMETSKILSMLWKEIGVKLVVEFDSHIWMDYGYNYNHYSEKYAVRNPDPNFILYAMTNHSMDGWNIIGTSNNSFDRAYDMQSSSLDPSDRALWVKECQKILFALNNPIIIAYPSSNYGYMDDRWTSWGDWNNHSFLYADYFFSENPLFFEIKWGKEIPVDYSAVIFGSLVAASSFLIVTYVVLSKRRKRKKRAEMLEEDPSDIELIDTR